MRKVLVVFKFQSLHETIGPLVLEFDPAQYEYLLVKIAAGKVTESVDYIHQQWKAFARNVPFDYNFLDEQYDQLYKSEKRMTMMDGGLPLRMSRSRNDA